jgi:hypothetical protein
MAPTNIVCPGPVYLTGRRDAGLPPGLAVLIGYGRSERIFRVQKIPLRDALMILAKVGGRAFFTTRPPLHRLLHNQWPVHNTLPIRDAVTIEGTGTTSGPKRCASSCAGGRMDRHFSGLGRPSRRRISSAVSARAPAERPYPFPCILGRDRLPMKRLEA